jgi:septum formation inhibitor MinC
MLQEAFLHPHFDILEVKKHEWTPQATTAREKNQERHLRKIKNNLTPFRSGVIVRPQDLRLLETVGPGAGGSNDGSKVHNSSRARLGLRPGQLR